MELNNIEELIADIRQGKMVVLMDDEDRENEGDLIMAAVHVRAEDINFMARYGRGLICLPLTPQRCKQLQLPYMVSHNSSPYGTNFTVSIEAARGVTTGISAADRALTIQMAVAADAKPSDLVQPGHIFPLVAQSGGVLRRAGHTEAGCDLARLAGLEPAAVLVEILNEDGTMARRPDLETFAQKHSLKIGTIADLIRFRLKHEKTVEKVAQCHFPTRYGEFELMVYQDIIDDSIHFALVRGQPKPEIPTFVRVHVHNTLCDLTASLREGCGWPLSDVMQRLGKEDNAVIVIIQQKESPEAIIDTIKAYHKQDTGEDLPAHPATDDLRTYGLGAQILTNVGVRKMRVLSARRRMSGLSGFGMEVVDYISEDKHL